MFAPALWAAYVSAADVSPRETHDVDVTPSPMTAQPAETLPAETLLVCNCQRTMQIDGAALAKALGRNDPLTVHTELCRGQLAAFETALATGKPVQVGCTQEAPLFREVAAEKGHVETGHMETELRFTNIRERAGWTASKTDTTAKMAALLAEAMHEPTPPRLLTLTSNGVCLVYGPGQIALDAAAAIADRMSVSVLLSDPGDALPPTTAAVPIAKGIIRKAAGRLGAFDIEVDGYAAVLPSARAKLDFALARNGAKSTCDVIVDLSGRTALFADSARRDGYLRADPAKPGAVWKTLLEATNLSGEFEKPLYVAYDAGICAHSRSAKVGCSKCLESCPTGAIAPDGDHVKIDPALCGGCGMCAAVCPTGAASYSYPLRSDVLARMQILLATYRGAGGTHPILLIHEEQHGGALISALARLGGGLPPNVIPLTSHTVTSFGHETLAAALALGAQQIVLLGSRAHGDEMAALNDEVALMRAFLTGLGYDGDRLHVLSTDDPDDLATLLTGLKYGTAIAPQAFSFAGSKREIARIALSTLHAAAPNIVERIALPKGAPYGRIAIKAEGCTLCLACVGACPANALADAPDKPQVSFTEAACVQCGVCVATCPEQVITLQPSYAFSPTAFNAEVLHSEQPFHCIVCSKAFGTKAIINKVVEKLKGRHAMFQNEQQLRLIQMCDTCRIVTLSEAGNDPMRLGERPRVITTDDYIAARAANKKTPTPDDFLN